MKLPSMVYASRKSEVEQVVFGGLNHSESAGESEFYEMRNLSSDLYPILSPRKQRWLICNQGDVKALCTVGNTLYFIQGSTLCRTSELERVIADGSIDRMAKVEELFAEAGMNGIIPFGKHLILTIAYKNEPYLLVYNIETGEHRRMEALIGRRSVTIGDGELYGETAKGNEITLLEDSLGFEALGFRAGDGVHIEVFSMDGEKLLTTDAVIREIDGRDARFDENIFGELYGSHLVTIRREAPPVGHFCVCNNRLFVCSGQTICASALGDPFNWQVYDGLSTDSWSVETADGGDFTGCTEYLGAPYFFKADAIYKLYGDYPSEYSLVKTSAFGVKEGASRSLAVVGNTLFYLSPAGVCAYAEGYPTVILPPEQMGGYPSSASAAAGDGHKYYVSIRLSGDYGGTEDKGGHAMYVYDTLRGVWHKEDAAVTPACLSGYPGTRQLNLYGVGGVGNQGIWLIGSPAFTASVDETGAEEFGHIEDRVESFAEFGEGYHDTMNAKKLWRLHIRLWVDKGAKVKISVSYDGGKYKVLREFGQTDKRSFVIPIAAKRCDHYRLRIDGIGEYKIYSLAREYTVSGKG